MHTPPVRAILDTNVFVGAGFNRHSASYKLIDAARHRRLIQVWAPETLAETQRVLDKIPRLSFAAVSDVFADAGRHDGALDLAAVDFVTDPEDRKFAALSLAAGAAIVTSDDDLLSHAERLNVWKPSAFLTAHLLT
ncbi:MAG: putative toxin-antitoxin system toxin component, PIN family [Pseudomonadota bacterium]